MPEIQVVDEQGTTHVFPDGSTPDMIAKAMNVKPPTPSLDLSNKQGQGTYAMWDTAGHKLEVPYGQVQRAAQQGYKFDTNPNKGGLLPAQQFQKDSSADPNRRTVFAPVANDPRANPEYTHQLEANAPLPIRVAGGVSKGAGTLARPVLDVIALGTGQSPQDVDEMLAPRSDVERAAKYGTVAAGIAPAAIAAPVATAGAIAGGTIGSAVGQYAGEKMGLNPQQSQLLGDVGGLVGGTAGGVGGSRLPNPIAAAKNFIAGPPEAQLTKALQPNKNNVNWNADVKVAMPQIKAAEQQLGKPIDGFDTATEATTLALKNIWNHVNQRLSAAGATGATIDGNQIADAMMNSIDKRIATQNPGVVSRIKAIADTYRRPLTTDEAEDFIQSNNSELMGYYGKNKVTRQVAQADPETNAKIVEGDALRDALYSKIDDLTGPGVAQLKKAYGAVRNVQKDLVGQQMIYARKAPANLGEQLTYPGAIGKLVTGDLKGAAMDIAVRRFMSDLNDKNSMIGRAFDQTQPAGSFPQPSNPRFAGLLPRGAIQTPPPADDSGPVSYQPPPVEATTRAQRLGLLLPEKAGGNVLPYYPQMTPDEEAVSRLHYLRNSK